MTTEPVRGRSRSEEGSTMSAVKVQDTDDEPFFTVPTLAKKLALSERTVRDILNRGEIQCYRIGPNRRIDPQDVKRWLEERKERR